MELAMMCLMDAYENYKLIDNIYGSGEIYGNLGIIEVNIPIKRKQAKKHLEEAKHLWEKIGKFIAQITSIKY